MASSLKICDDCGRPSARITWSGPVQYSTFNHYPLWCLCLQRKAYQLWCAGWSVTFIREAFAAGRLLRMKP